MNANTPITRRTALAASALAAAQFAALPVFSQTAKPKAKWKKSINLWSFPYREGRMTLRECLELANRYGFDAVELNYALDLDIQPKSGAAEYAAIRKMADDIGIEISGLCSGLFWKQSITSEAPAEREQGMELMRQMVQAAHDLGAPNILIVPGAVNVPWRKEYAAVNPDTCLQRATEGVKEIAKLAEKLKVFVNVENVFLNDFLTVPEEINAFVDSIGSEWVKAHFDTGNTPAKPLPEHWIPTLGNRIQNTHFKDVRKRGAAYSPDIWRTLLDGTTNWPAVMSALEASDYRGFITVEYFRPYQPGPEVLIEQTAKALDVILASRV